MRRLILVIAALSCSISTLGTAPERTVSGHTVYSLRDPEVQIQLPEDVNYIGADRFILTKPKLGDFDVCELHVFVDADKSGSLRKVYWVQFEHLLSKYPKLHFKYDSPRHATIGGMDFYVDTEVTDGTGKSKPGSDGEHFHNLLAAHGYKRVPMMFVRLVHLVDAAKRKELMIIVGKDLPAGVSAASVKKGSPGYAAWPALEQSLIDWAVSSIVIKPQAQSSGG